MLTIRTTRDGYSLDYSRHQQGAELRRMFGTMIVPLPFTAAMPVASVITHVGALHPGCAVSVQAEGQSDNRWDMVGTSVR